MLEGYVRDTTHIYTVTPNRDIHGTKYSIPSSLTEGTNLAHDTYVSYEELPGATDCTPSQFLAMVDDSKEVTDDGVSYLVGHALGAGAGNRYDETIFVFKDYKPCTAIRYFIHYGAIENYPPGAVQAFDSVKLSHSLDAIRRTLAKSR